MIEETATEGNAELIQNQLRLQSHLSENDYLDKKLAFSPKVAKVEFRRNN
jgi:hypothetical protein